MTNVPRFSLTHFPDSKLTCLTVTTKAYGLYYDSDHYYFETSPIYAEYDNVIGAQNDLYAWDAIADSVANGEHPELSEHLWLIENRLNTAIARYYRHMHNITAWDTLKQCGLLVHSGKDVRYVPTYINGDVWYHIVARTEHWAKCVKFVPSGDEWNGLFNRIEEYVSIQFLENACKYIGDKW